MINIPLRPVSLIKNMLEQLGQDISCAYEDLVFVEHNAFILQMGDPGSQVHLFFNQDTAPAWRAENLPILQQAAAEEGLHLDCRGLYSLEEKPGEEIAIHFQPLPNATLAV
jgi:hypothetical protein